MPTPKKLAARMRSEKSDPRRLGTRRWIEFQPKRIRDEIVATVEEYLKGRATGEITMALPDFTGMLADEYGFPFEWTSLRRYMQCYHRKLFKQQVRER